MKPDHFNFLEFMDFIRQFSGVQNLPITRNTLVENDLGVTGDDAEELIITIAEKYCVAITEFNFSKYFHPEPSVFNTGLNRNIEPLTIGHLEKAILNGYLNDEIISG